MNETPFFAYLRTNVFSGHLSQGQVDGVHAILSACDKLGVTDIRQKAAVLATPCIETGCTFEPTVESLNYTAASLISKFSGSGRITIAQANAWGRTSKHIANQIQIGNTIYGGAWGAKNLGNTQSGDGYNLRGRGLTQLTGRRLYELGSKLVGVDLLTYPEKANEQATAALLLVAFSRDGVFTGKKLSTYIHDDVCDFKNARRIVNGTDKADQYAAFCNKMLTALKLAA